MWATADAASMLLTSETRGASPQNSWETGLNKQRAVGRQRAWIRLGNGHCEETVESVKKEKTKQNRWGRFTKLHLRTTHWRVCESLRCFQMFSSLISATALWAYLGAPWEHLFQLCRRTAMDLHGLLPASTPSIFFLEHKELEGKQGPSSQEAFFIRWTVFVGLKPICSGSTLPTTTSSCVTESKIITIIDIPRPLFRTLYPSCCVTVCDKGNNLMDFFTVY